MATMSASPRGGAQRQKEGRHSTAPGGTMQLQGGSTASRCSTVPGGGSTTPEGEGRSTTPEGEGHSTALGSSTVPGGGSVAQLQVGTTRRSKLLCFFILNDEGNRRVLSNVRHEPKKGAVT